MSKISNNVDLSTDAIKARRNYLNNWRKNNPDKVRQYNKRYWEKQAQQNNNGDKKE